MQAQTAVVPPVLALRSVGQAAAHVRQSSRAVACCDGAAAVVAASMVASDVPAAAQPDSTQTLHSQVQLELLLMVVVLLLELLWQIALT